MAKWLLLVLLYSLLLQLLLLLLQPITWRPDPSRALWRGPLVRLLRERGPCTWARTFRQRNFLQPQCLAVRSVAANEAMVCAIYIQDEGS